MAHFKIKRGLDIPIAHFPNGSIQNLIDSELVGLDLSSFSNLRLRLLKNENDEVLIGQPIVEDKECSGRVFMSCASGIIKKIIRGEKRSIKTIIIQKTNEDKYYEGEKIAYDLLGKEDILTQLHTSGLLCHIRSRPLDRMAHPSKLPKSIFVKGLESAPFLPSSEMQIQGHEKEFQEGLNLLSKIADVHLVIKKGSSSFSEIKNVQLHTVEGPHPIANQSLHIYKIDPITNPHETIWTLSVVDAICIGMWAVSGRYFIDRVISLAGPGVIKEKAGYFRTKMGCSINAIIQNNLVDGDLRIISGDPLMGKQVDKESFLGFFHSCVSVFCENHTREPFHFFRPGWKKFTAGKTYLSGFKKRKPFHFTTNQHGEERPFVDGQIYERVMPMRIPTMQLMKALISEDYDTAVELGLLEVAPEDFALATFVCPSKIDMVKIVFEGMKKYAAESGV